MSDAPLELQGALVTRLRAVSAVTDLLATPPAGFVASLSIYDHVPEIAVREGRLPYVAVGSAQEVDRSTKDTQGYAHRHQIDVWSSYRGNLEARQIQAAIDDALTRQESLITVTGHRLVESRITSSMVFLEPDGITRHGVQQWRALTHAL